MQPGVCQGYPQSWKVEVTPSDSLLIFSFSFFFFFFFGRAAVEVARSRQSLLRPSTLSVHRAMQRYSPSPDNFFSFLASCSPNTFDERRSFGSRLVLPLPRASITHVTPAIACLQM